MRFHHLALIIVALTAPGTRLAARETIGTFATWAAFCDEPRKCFAISEPAERTNHPSLSIAIHGSNLSVQAHLGRKARAAALRIGDAEFTLTVSGELASADPRTSRRIVAAMREGESATLVGTSDRGGRFRHHYLLAGAPSAIDAAAVASLR